MKIILTQVILLLMINSVKIFYKKIYYNKYNKIIIILKINLILTP
jgi:hypothetical protein